MVLIASAVHQRRLVPADPRPRPPLQPLQQHVAALKQEDSPIRHPTRRRPLPLLQQRRDRAPSRLLEWQELPGWQKEDNSFVETGYRPPHASVWSCVASWFYLHNESVNIVSHLLGALLFFWLPSVLPSSLLWDRYARADGGDVIVFAVYLLGVAMCFALSAAFHTLTSHSARGYAVGLQLDFLGIVLLIWAATAPLAYYTFHGAESAAEAEAEAASRQTYWALTSCFAVLAAVVTFTPAFHRPATKPLRAGVFGALGLSTLACVAHGLVAHGWKEQTRRFPMWAVGGSLLMNTTGAVIYVSRFPERWWRRTFDIFGASHQLMHGAIVVSALVWVAGMVEAFDNAHAP